MGKLVASDLIAAIEDYAPLALKEGNDPTGFQIGRRDKSIERVLVTLDVRPETVQEAIEQNVDFIFAHHPVMFRPARNLDLSDPQNKMYADLLTHDITVYAAHTNLDKTNGGMNDWLAEALQLNDVQPFNITDYQSLVKLVVFVPESHAEQMRMALNQADAGHIGDYQACSFSTTGIGRFQPTDAANPYIGQSGDLEAVTEVKIEVVLPVAMQTKVVQAMLAAHPYEEPVYDVIPLANQQQPIGIGRIGQVAQSMTVRDYAQFVCETFDLTGLRLISNEPDKIVQTVAVVGGDGGKFFPAALQAGADVYITGDVYYHTGHDMLAAGLSVIDPGHHVESIVKDKMTGIFEKWAKQRGWSVTFIKSQQKTDPFTFIFNAE